MLSLISRRSLISLLLPLALTAAVPVAAADKLELRVMSFNLWHGGDAGGQPLEQTAAVIRATNADLVGLQETHGHEVNGVRPNHGARLSTMLGWHYFDQGDRTGILSRFPIINSTPRKWGAEIQLPNGTPLLFFNAHFAASPYQPYQLLDIPYGDAPFIRTEAEAIHWAQRTRGGQADRLRKDITPYLQRDIAVVVTGDFNEPSFQDWTPAATIAGLCPLPVKWPATARLHEMQIQDAYRIAHPDETKAHGWTWTPTTKVSDPKDRHDRIDFVFVRTEFARVKKCEVVGESSATSGIVVKPWPSDHRAVMATIQLNP